MTGCTKGRAGGCILGGLHNRAGRRAALKGGLQNRAGQQAAEKGRAGGLHMNTCRRAAEKDGSFDTRADWFKNYYFSQLQTFIALYKMADRSLRGRTSFNTIEIASFRRSSRCATWRAFRYNIARTSCFENDDLAAYYTQWNS